MAAPVRLEPRTRASRKPEARPWRSQRALAPAGGPGSPSSRRTSVDRQSPWVCRDAARTSSAARRRRCPLRRARVEQRGCTTRGGLSNTRSEVARYHPVTLHRIPRPSVPRSDRLRHSVRIPDTRRPGSDHRHARRVHRPGMRSRTARIRREVNVRRCRPDGAGSAACHPSAAGPSEPATCCLPERAWNPLSCSRDMHGTGQRPPQPGQVTDAKGNSRLAESRSAGPTANRTLVKA